MWFDENNVAHGEAVLTPNSPASNACKTEFFFAMNYEVHFVYNFTVDEENRPRGCNILDLDMSEIRALPLDQRYIDCPKNMYAPEGKPVSQIVKDFALDHDFWAKTFLDAWHKMQANGYGEDKLKDGPKSSWLGYSFLKTGGKIILYYFHSTIFQVRNVRRNAFIKHCYFYVHCIL